jgi:hypothetical protein
VLSLTQARQFFSEAGIRHRVAAGRWQRPHRGVYLASTGTVTDEQRRWVAVLAAGDGATLAGPTATELYGLRPARTNAVHLLLPARRHVDRLPAAVIPHRTTRLAAADVQLTALPPRTMPARSIVDAAAWASSDDTARAVVAAGFQRGLVTVDEINTVLTRLPRTRRRGLIVRTAQDAAGGSHSLAELDYLGANRRAGLPEPTRQARRRDAAGRQRYLDVLYERWGVHVEIDGGQHHDPAVSWADMKRQNDIWIAGDRVLRFPAWLVRERPGEVFSQVRAALIAAGWRQS